MSNIVESSPAAKALADRRAASDAPLRASYPFDDLKLGQSFTYKIDAVNWKSLRVLMYKKNKEYAGTREFAFLKHDDVGIVEVARIV